MVSLLGSKEADSSYWFIDGVIKRVSLGFQTFFWKNLQLRTIRLETNFPGSFSYSVQPNRLVGAIDAVVNRVLTWNLRWQRPWFESTLLRALFQTSAYLAQMVNLITFSVPLFIKSQILPLIWISQAPYNILVLAQHILQDRLPTRENLSKREVFLYSSLISCSLCEFLVDLISHLFITCELTLHVQCKIFRWLGWWIVILNDPNIIFDVFISLRGMSKFVEGYLLI